MVIAIAGCGDLADPDVADTPQEALTAAECVVVNPGPGPYDGLVGLCHITHDEHHADPYVYMRVTRDACEQGHVGHVGDFRSDDPLCHWGPPACVPGGSRTGDPGRCLEPPLDRLQ